MGQNKDQHIYEMILGDISFLTSHEKGDTIWERTEGGVHTTTCLGRSLVGTGALLLQNVPLERKPLP